MSLEFDDCWRTPDPERDRNITLNCELRTAMPMSQPPSELPEPQLLGVEGLSWYDVPESVKQSLDLASTHWDKPEVGDRHMDRALAEAERHPDVLVSAYRYFFYTHNYERALQVATTVLDMVRERESLPEEWSQLQSILRDRQDEAIVRLYINAYAASGLVRARLGELDRAKQIAAQVSELERQNEFGGKVVQEILEHPDDEDEDD